MIHLTNYLKNIKIQKELFHNLVKIDINNKISQI